MVSVVTKDPSYLIKSAACGWIGKVSIAAILRACVFWLCFFCRSFEAVLTWKISQSSKKNEK
jgi:hypothetical protein